MGGIKRFLMINLGVAIMAVGLYFFLIPANLAVGGVTGLAMVIQNYLPSMNLGVLMSGFNLILFILAFTIIGREFGGYTIYCSFLLSGLIGLLELMMPLESALANDLMINLIFGILIQGIGMAVIFYQNASTGGTDIIAKIINKFTGLGIGRALFLSDSLITLMAGSAFGMELGLFAFLGILINGLVIDKAIEAFEIKFHALIISDNYDQISEYVQRDLHRGITYLNGIGGYTLERRQILSIVLSKREYTMLKQYIRRNDPSAFYIVNPVNEVIGNGFGGK